MLADRQAAGIGTSWIVCHHHHPEGRPTAEQVAQVHSEILTAEHAALERATRLLEDDPAHEPQGDERLGPSHSVTRAVLPSLLRR